MINPEHYDYWKQHAGNPHERGAATFIWVEGPHEIELDLPEFMHGDAIATFTIDNYGEPDTSAPLVNIQSVTMNGEPMDTALYNVELLAGHITAYIDSNPEPYQIEEGSGDA